MKFLTHCLALAVLTPVLAFAEGEAPVTPVPKAVAQTAAADALAVPAAKKRESAKVDSHIYSLTADPAKDLAAAIVEAKKSNKHILLEVGGDWCVWCRRLEGVFVSNPALTALRDQNFVLVHVNFSDENENKAFLSKYPKVAGYPHIFVLDQDGKLLHSHNTSDLEDGKSYSIANITAFLEKWKAV